MAPPTKRHQPHRASLSSPASSGAVALQGWPSIVWQRWHAIKNQRVGHNNRIALSKPRQVELFVRELMAHGELPVLQLVVAHDYHPAQTLAQRKLPVNDVQFAIRSGHADTMQWAFTMTAMRVATPERLAWYWKEILALDASVQPAMLDVLVKHTIDDAAIWRKAAELVDPTVRNAVLLPKELLVDGDTDKTEALARYLARVPDKVAEILFEDKAWYTPRKIAQLIRNECWDRHLRSSNARSSAFVELLATYRLHPTAVCAMDLAAANGDMEILEFLHGIRFETCTTEAMDQAAARGHLAIVQFLHANREEGCTREAMQQAERNGFGDVVAFLQIHWTALERDPDALLESTRRRPTGTVP